MGNACGCCASPRAVTSPTNTNTPHLVQTTVNSSDIHVTSPTNTNTPHLVQTTVASSDIHVCPLSIDSLVEKMTLSLNENGDLTQQIDVLINFMEDVLSRIKAPREAASTSTPSSSGVSQESQEFMASHTKAAAELIDFVSSEADKLKSTEVIPNEMGRVTMKVLDKISEKHWVFLGLSLVAYAFNRWVTANSNVSGCNEVLEKLIDLAKDFKKFKEAVPEEREKVSKALFLIVKGTIICLHYIQKGGVARYFSAEVVQSQLQKIRESIKDYSDSLTRGAVVRLLRQKTHLPDQLTLNCPECQPEGIKDRITEVKEMLDMEGSESAVAVILWGLGGVGKSTLADSVIQNLNLTSTKFCKVSIDEEKLPWKPHVTELQQKIILHLGGQKYDIGDPKEGRKLVQKEMENKSCLLYIDNVADGKYIPELLPKEFLPGTEKSKLVILITSRERNLRLPGVKKIKGYNVKELPLEAARKLLSKTILQDEGKFYGDFDEEGLMNDVAEECKGVPLLLSVFGNYLRDHRDEDYYKDAIEALREGNPESFTDEGQVGEKLFFVYHHIDENQKEAFLDICAYFCGLPWQQVRCIVGNRTLETLKDKSLVNRGDRDAVIVHDILRLRGIKEAKQTRLTNYEEFLQIKDDASKLKTIKGIAFSSDRSLITLKSEHLNAMHKSLRVLILGDWVKLDGPPCDRAFTNLRYLRVGDLKDFPFRDAAKLETLRVLCNGSKPGMDLPQLPGTLRAVYHYVPQVDCKEFAELPLQNLTQLEEFVVETKKPILLPQGLELPSSLKYLRLTNCKQTPRRFGHLIAFENLRLDKCDLESLPGGFGLHKLKFLSLADCTNLITISQGLETLSSLTSLRLEGCTRVEMLPDLGKLTALQELRMINCENLMALPEEFGRLSFLQNLDLTGCIKLQRLPESFGSLSIQDLSLTSLVSLEELPQSIGKLQNLKCLSLIGCNSLICLPNSFLWLTKLESLRIIDCLNLGALPKDFGKLCSLHDMTLDNCHLLKELPQGFHELPALKILDLSCSSSLVNLPAKFGELIRLEDLTLRSLSLSSLPDEFGNLKGLTMLQAIALRKLETLPQGFENLASLRYLRFSNCPMLNGAAMDQIFKLQKHCDVYIRGCPRLEERRDAMQQEERLIAVQTSESDVWNRQVHQVEINRPPAKQRGGRKQEKFPCFNSLEEENKISDKIGEFKYSICGGRNQAGEAADQSLGEESVFTKFTQALKNNKIDHLIHSNQRMVGVDKLRGKVVAILVSDSNTPEFVVLQKIYRYAQDKQLSLEVIWIPLSMSYGFGTYTRAVQGMPWAAFADPTVVNIEAKIPRLIVFDEDGWIANPDALALVMCWGVEAYPFTQLDTDKFISDINLSLEFLLSDIELSDDRGVRVTKHIKNGKLIFVYAEPPGQKFQMKSKLEKLTQTYKNFEVLYVGYLFMENDMERLEQMYKNATKKMQWLKLSFENMIMFWYRCKYFSCEQNLSNELQGSTLEKLVKHLYIHRQWLVLLDEDGIVTAGGEEVVEMLCTSKDEGKDKVDVTMKEQWMESLKAGKCNEVMKLFLKDELSNYPEHPQHLLLLHEKSSFGRYICDVCDRRIADLETRHYRCNDCNWDLCRNCWKLFAEKQVQQLSLTKGGGPIILEEDR